MGELIAPLPHPAGVPIETFWSEHQHPERIAELEATIDQACRPNTVAQTLKLIDGHDDRILQHLLGGARRSPPPPASEPAPIIDQAERAVQAAPTRALLGGVTITRRHRDAPAADTDVDEPAPPEPVAATTPAPSPVSPPPTAPEREPAAIAPDPNDAEPDEPASPDAGARRLAPIRRTIAEPGASPLLDSLQEDLERLRQARKRRHD